MKKLLLPMAVSVTASLCFAAAPPLQILPAGIELRGPQARQQLLAEADWGGVAEDATRVAVWSSSNPAVAKVDAAGLLLPVSDGETVITAKRDTATATVKVRVRDTKAPFEWSFRNHVVPVLSKVGCNQGACHGALAGKNGFKLTLRGYDPEVDYDTLTRQSVGRRVSLSDPASSLMLLKPTFGVAHGGGKRFGKDSLEYRIILDWIAAGAPKPTAKDPEVTGLQVFPKAAVLRPGATQQLVVMANYSDGHSEDVTHWVKYTSNSDSTASVDDNGRVKMTGAGEAAISLWYSSRVLYSSMTVPFENKVSDEAYQRLPRKNFIDDFVLAKLKSLHLAPSHPCSDSEFIRRASLDSTGTLPSTEEVESFLADKSAEKRAKLVDRLLASDEYVDYWAYKWSDLLLVSSRKLRSPAMWAFYKWIRESVKENKPWDQFANEIFTTSGSNREHGQLNYFVLHKDPIELTENAVQAFLGQRLTCARCHNHPLEKWTQKQYYQMANLFSRVGIKNGSDAGEVVIFAKTSGDINHPRLLRPLAPTPLDGKPMALDSTEDRRLHFARWLTSADNPYFSRAIVNRIWASLMGRGLADPLDDVRISNPTSNEELFQALIADFQKNNHDVKHLIRTIMLSGTYQASAEANETNKDDNKYYSKYIVKRLPAEVILDALSQITGVPTPFSGYPAGTRALELPDSQVKSQFLTSFGRPQRSICDASERSSDPSIAQALHVINGDTLNRKLSAADGSIASFLKLGLSDSRILEYLFLSGFSRYPTALERQQLTEALAKSRLTTGTVEAQKEARRQALEDMMWALLTSKEFLFNH